MAGNFFVKTEPIQIPPEETKPNEVAMISVTAISPNPSQPRAVFSDEALMSLADSIRSHGIIQPLTVRRTEIPSRFELIAGERRLRAARLCGMTCVPCMIFDADRHESAMLAIIENLQRADLNMFEEAKALCALSVEHSMTQEEIARKLSCSQSYVANKLRLLRLAEEERALILENSLTERHARALVRIKDTTRRMSALKLIIRGRLNVAATEDLCEAVVKELESQLVLDDLEKTFDEKGTGKRRFILKDIRMFYNSLDRAVTIVRSAGIDIRSRKIETEEATEIRITIPK